MSKKSLIIVLGVVALFALCVVGFIYLSRELGSFYYVRDINEKIPKVPASGEYISSTSSYLWSEWKTYNDDKYGFSITYPAKSYVFKRTYNTIDKVCLNSERKILADCIGKCGTAIVDKKDTSGNYEKIVIFDNLLSLYISKWNKTIIDFMKQNKVENLYKLDKISGTGADEAYTFGKIDTTKLDEWREKTGEEFPPLSYVNALYKKGNYLYEIGSFQSYASENACYVDREMLNNKVWGLDKIIKFYK